VDGQLYRQVAGATGIVVRAGRAWHVAARTAGCLLALLLLLPGEAGTRVSAWTLAVVGDVMLGRGVAQALGGEWEAAFAEVRPWLAAEDGAEAWPCVGRGSRAPTWAFANLESPLAAMPQIATGYDLRAPPSAAAALRAAGFQAVSLANNHALDAGVVGRRETEGVLRAAGIDPWTPGRAAWCGPGCVGLALDDSAAPLDLEQAVGAVSRAARRAEVVLVSIHWGGEYQAAPSIRQQTIARALACAGADVIAGHGPHVLQRVEQVEGALVAYSLGNFLFDQAYPLDCRWGAILRVAVCDGRVTAVEAVPTVTQGGRVRPADPETVEAILGRLRLAEGWQPTTSLGAAAAGKGQR
jgi:hypothetical protein